MELYILTIIHALLQLFDWYSTSVILKRGGYEQNPIMVKLFNLNRFNVDLVMGLKVIFFCPLGYFIGSTSVFIPICEKYNLNITIEQPYLLLPLIAIYSWVAYHNGKSL
jgi:hypothetical protein